MDPAASSGALALLRIAPEVADALAAGHPVVALESTLISHGLPSPRNVEVALAAEAAVRREGAVPATIAVHGGRLVVGLTNDEIEALAAAGPVAKASRHNLAAALGVRRLGRHDRQRHHDRGAPGRHPRLRHRRHRRRPPGRRVEPRHLRRPRRAGTDAGPGRVCRPEVDPRRATHAGGARDARRAGHRPGHRRACPGSSRARAASPSTSASTRPRRPQRSPSAIGPWGSARGCW